MPKLNLVTREKVARKPLQSVAARPVPVAVPPEPSNSDDQKDHFKTDPKTGAKYAGDHVILDLFGAKGLNDQPRIERAMRDAVKAAGATLLFIHLHPFEGGGITGVAVLSESHISVHTWPESGYAAFDLFMCGDAVPRNGIPILQEAFETKNVAVGCIRRGVRSL